MKKIQFAILVILLIVLIGLSIKIPTKEIQVSGGWDIMNSTSTASTAVGFLANSDPLVIKRIAGTLGSVIITASGNATGGMLNFYDATTTNINLRKSTMGTSSIILASIPTDSLEGTYPFNIPFINGLLVDFTGTAGSQGTTTITYK